MGRTKGYGSITLIRKPLPASKRGADGKPLIDPATGKPYLGQPKKDRQGRSIWLLRLDMGAASDDGRNRPHRYTHGTKAQAKRDLAEWKTEVESGLKANADDILFRAYAETWHQNRVIMKSVRPSTLDQEGKYIAKIDAYIGNAKVADIDVATVRNLYSRMTKDGVTPGFLQKYHIKLKQILGAAMDDDIIMRNPCERVKVPKPKQVGKRKSLTEDQAARLLAVLDAAGDTDARAVGVRIGLATGMRMGEVLGLTWEHVDLESGSLDVVEQYTRYGRCKPKTDAGIRRIALDADTVEHMRAWRGEQKIYLKRIFTKEDGTVDLRAFSAYWKRNERTLPVVCNEKGLFHEPNDYRRWFQGFCVLNGFAKWVDDDGNEVKPTYHDEDGHRLDGNGHDAGGRPYSRMNPKPHVRKHYSGLKFHELRHTQATLLIANGADIKTVQHRLGHANVSLTLDLYAHATPENDRKAAETIGSILSSKPVSKVVNL